MSCGSVSRLDGVELGIGAGEPTLAGGLRGLPGRALAAEEAPDEEDQQDDKDDGTADAELQRSALREAELRPAQEIGQAFPERRAARLFLGP